MTPSLHGMDEWIAFFPLRTLFILAPEEVLSQHPLVTK